nr:MobA/MobL family protein [Rickettsia monacensis]
MAKAAYISASKLMYKTIDKESGEAISITYDFSKKTGVAYSKIFVPEEFKDISWLKDREQLWNAAEAREKRVVSRPGAEIEFALPKEVTKENHCFKCNSVINITFGNFNSNNFSLIIDYHMKLESKKPIDRTTSHFCKIIKSSVRINSDIFTYCKMCGICIINSRSFPT